MIQPTPESNIPNPQSTACGGHGAERYKASAVLADEQPDNRQALLHLAWAPAVNQFEQAIESCFPAPETSVGGFAYINARSAISHERSHVTTTWQSVAFTASRMSGSTSSVRTSASGNAALMTAAIASTRFCASAISQLITDTPCTWDWESHFTLMLQLLRYRRKG